MIAPSQERLQQRVTFTLTEEQVKSFHPLPGHVLIKTDPPKYETESGLVAIPQGVAHYRQEAQEVRKGKLVRMNRFGKGPRRYRASVGIAHFWDGEADSLHPGQTIYYYGHLNEAANEYVVAKIGQIVAVVETQEDSKR